MYWDGHYQEAGTTATRLTSLGVSTRVRSPARLSVCATLRRSLTVFPSARNLLSQTCQPQAGEISYQCPAALFLQPKSFSFQVSHE